MRDPKVFPAVGDVIERVGQYRQVVKVDGAKVWYVSGDRTEHWCLLTTWRAWAAKSPCRVSQKLPPEDGKRLKASLQQDADFEGRLVLTADMARRAADALFGNNADDVAEFLGTELAVKVCEWVAKRSGLLTCEHCGNYERTLYPVDGYDEAACVECKQDLDLETDD